MFEAHEKCNHPPRSFIDGISDSKVPVYTLNSLDDLMFVLKFEYKITDCTYMYVQFFKGPGQYVIFFDEREDWFRILTLQKYIEWFQEYETEALYVLKEIQGKIQNIKNLQTVQ